MVGLSTKVATEQFDQGNSKGTAAVSYLGSYFKRKKKRYSVAAAFDTGLKVMGGQNL